MNAGVSDRENLQQGIVIALLSENADKGLFCTAMLVWSIINTVSYTHLTLPTNREV